MADLQGVGAPMRRSLHYSRVTSLGGTHKETAPLDAGRWANVNWWAMAAILVATVDAGMWWVGTRAGMVLWPSPGIDFTTYRDAAQSWFGGTGFYLPYELAGPFTATQVSPQPVMYPPTTAPLFLVLTAIPLVWWIAPFALVGWRMRRATIARLAFVAALIAWPGSVYAVVTGNPGLWIMAALSLGLGSVVLLKPTLAPFLLAGIRSRRWWAGAALLGLVSVALLPMWSDYLTVLRNARGTDLLYSIWQWPLIGVGVVAARGGS